jgi:deoxycytidine triphosphate deaminase
VKKIYLACPYSHQDARVRAARFDAAGRLMEAGSRIAQIVFHEVCGCTLPYGDKPGAKYMHQTGATAPR